MSPETLKQILAKATQECNVTGVALYNWTEPLLHPRLPEMVRVVNNFGLQCHLSSNLNKVRNLEAVMAEDPFFFRVSLSGFNQEHYGITHKGGDIELVKNNMRLLADLKANTGAKTDISVAFHRYLSNLDEEFPMKAFSEQLDFRFESWWAFLMPLEKILAADGADGYGTISHTDEKVIGNLALPLKEALTDARSLGKTRCILQEDQVVLDFLGQVQLCCGTYDRGRFTISNYLEKPIEEIQALKARHSTCEVCVKHAAHNYGTYNIPHMDTLAKKNIELHSNEDTLQKYGSLQTQLDLEQAVSLQKAGQMQDAELICRKILLKHPNQSVANYNLGVFSLEDGRADDSLPFFRSALEAMPQEAQYWLGYIDALIQAAHYEEAQMVLSCGLEAGLSGPEMESLEAALNNKYQSDSLDE